MKKETKKKNLVLFFIKMVIALLLFDIIMYQIYPTLARMILYGKYGTEAIIEAVCAFIILIVLILFGNSYIFTEKKQGFFKSLKVGAFMLCFATIYLVMSITNVIGSTSYLDVGSLAIYCLLIGIFEEFLCRGWIQNEFIERFASNRKQVYLSIFLSALIFGGIHISNIWIGGQSVLDTLSQIIQATGMGFLLGATYYRTKNIWSVVFMHGYWDFCILLNSITTIKDCTQGAVSTEYQIGLLTGAFIFSIIYILIGLFILRKNKTIGYIENEEITEKEIAKSKNNSAFIIVIIVILYFVTGCIPLEEQEEICYDYSIKELPYTEVVYPVYEEYIIEENNIKLFIKDNKFLIQDLTTNKEYYFKEDYIEQFIIIKNNNTYEILLQGLNEYQTDTVIYYTNFIIGETSLENILNSFTNLESAPTTSQIGYIKNADNKYYLFIETRYQDILILENNEFYILNYQSSQIIEEYVEQTPTTPIIENSEKTEENTIDESLQERTEQGA